MPEAVRRRPWVILSVEDDHVKEYILERLLRATGATVHHCSRGATAIQMAAVKQPDIILLDVNLGDTTGYKVLEDLRKNQATASIPVVFVSASGRAIDHRQKVLAQGAVEFIETPADPKVLLDTIESAIARSPSRHRQAG